MRLIGFVAVFALLCQAPANAEGRPFIGVDLGVSEATDGNYRAHVKTGGSGNPFVGYMFNDYLGLQAQMHVAVQPPDDDNKGIKHEDEISTLLGGTVGPRLEIPLGDLVTMYGTGQGGYFGGVSGRLGTDESGPGFSVGGGLDFNVTRNVALGLFGRWNLAYVSPRPDVLPRQKWSQQHGDDIRWATAGVGLKYSFLGPEPAPPPPPPPPVAKPAPPPPPPVKKQIVLRGVNFDTDKSNIRPDARPVLDEAIEVLKSEGTISIVAAGHTDSRASDAYNQKLSERRANAVKDYLVKGGIDPARITAEGYGESKPVASNDTADGRAQNRRVELHVK